ncbi:MAG: CaiB/BaiF CoA-transferase family protein, partial [Alphaproteobacteria bacterium]
MGAEVIKIEQPGAGDQGRQMYPLDGKFKEAGFSCIYMSANAGKRSVTLDLKHPEAVGIVRRLVRDADVVVENFKAGTMGRMGLGWDDLKAVNSKLVYCAVAGFGQTGPCANALAYDPTIQAIFGIMALNGTPETGPMRVGAIICDMSSAITAAFAIAGALFKRERTGEGAYLDLSMQDVVAAMVSPNLLQTAHGFEPKLMGSRSLSGNPLAEIHPTKKGVLLLIPAVEAQSQRVWAVIGRPELAADPRFATLEARIANAVECHAVLREALAAADAKTWERRFIEAGVPAAAVATLPDVLKDGQLVHRNAIRSIPAPAVERDVIYCNTPFKISGEATGIDRPPPTLGADTDTVLSEHGYTRSEIEALRDSAAI